MYSLWKWLGFHNHTLEIENFLREELCGKNQHSEQYEMFRYTAAEDLEAIFKYKDHVDLLQIIEDVKGNLDKFLKEYHNKPQEAHFLLLAAYRYGKEPKKLTVHELVTAFYSLSAAIDDPDFILRKPSKEYLTEEQMSLLPENERVCIAINRNQLTIESISHLEQTIFTLGQKSISFGALKHDSYQKTFYEITSASMLEKLTVANMGKKLTYNFGLPPRRKYIEAIFNDQYSFALLSPYSKSPHKLRFLHGASLEKSSIWVARHDIVHLNNRAYLKKLYGDQFGAEFKNAILTLESIYESRPPIQSTVIEEGYSNAHLSKEANVDDLTTRLIDELLILYLDGELNFPSIPNKNSDSFANDLKKDLQQVMELITYSTIEYPHHGRVFENTQSETKNQAIQKALNLIEPELRIILFPPMVQSFTVINDYVKKP